MATLVNAYWMFLSFQGGATGIGLSECSSLAVFRIDYSLNAASGKGLLKPEAIKHLKQPRRDDGGFGAGPRQRFPPPRRLFLPPCSLLGQWWMLSTLVLVLSTAFLGKESEYLQPGFASREPLLFTVEKKEAQFKEETCSQPTYMPNLGRARPLIQAFRF